MSARGDKQAHLGGSPSSTAKLLAVLLGFSLPLSGDIGISDLIAKYPDQLSPVRLVTFLCLSWALSSRRASVSIAGYRALIGVSLAILGYAALTAVWAPDVEAALFSLLRLAIAMASGLAVLLVVGRERKVLISLILGVAGSLALQVCIALVELRTGRHLSSQFGSSSVSEWSLARIEDLTGSVAWGTLGNPNNLGGYFLLAIALVLTLGAHGAQLGHLSRLALASTLALAAVIGLTGLEDARGFKLGLLALGLIHLVDRTIPREPMLRAATLVISAAGALLMLNRTVSLRQVQALSWGQSDDVRLELADKGLRLALRNGGMGMGIGAESSLIEAGQIPTNFHNLTVRTAVELGFVVAAILLWYVLRPVTQWALGQRLGEGLRNRAISRDRAILTVALLVSGIVSSSVINDSYYWAFLALLGVNVVYPEESSGLRQPSARPSTESTATNALHSSAETAGRHRQGKPIRA